MKAPKNTGPMVTIIDKFYHNQIFVSCLDDKKKHKYWA